MIYFTALYISNSWAFDMCMYNVICECHVAVSVPNTEKFSWSYDNIRYVERKP